MNEQITVAELEQTDFTTITDEKIDEIGNRINSVTDAEKRMELLLHILDEKYRYFSDKYEKENPQEPLVISNENIHKFMIKFPHFAKELYEYHEEMIKNSKI